MRGGETGGGASASATSLATGATSRFLLGDTLTRSTFGFLADGSSVSLVSSRLRLDFLDTADTARVTGSLV